MKPKHTPRPWTAERVPTSCGYAWRIGPIGACLYVDSRGGVCNPDMPEEEAEANAHLIEAAPDLLEALVELVESYRKDLEALDRAVRARARERWLYDAGWRPGMAAPHIYEEHARRWNQAKAAIAKACPAADGRLP